MALTSPTSGGRSVGIVRSRTKATELVNILYLKFEAKIADIVSKIAVLYKNVV
jgi:hypothetical protein